MLKHEILGGYSQVCEMAKGIEVTMARGLRCGVRKPGAILGGNSYIDCQDTTVAMLKVVWRCLEVLQVVEPWKSSFPDEVYERAVELLDTMAVLVLPKKDTVFFDSEAGKAVYFKGSLARCGGYKKTKLIRYPADERCEAPVSVNELYLKAQNDDRNPRFVTIRIQAEPLYTYTNFFRGVEPCAMNGNSPKKVAEVLRDAGAPPNRIERILETAICKPPFMTISDGSQPTGPLTIGLDWDDRTEGVELTYRWVCARGMQVLENNSAKLNRRGNIMTLGSQMKCDFEAFQETLKAINCAILK